MGKSDKAVKLVDSIFDEGFEDYSKIKAAERHIDLLLDMCGVPHHRKKLKENMGPLASSMYTTGRPYDHPRKIRVKPIVDVNVDVPVDEIEADMSECDAIQGEKYPGEFDGASPNNMPEEEPAKEMTPQKKQNKINHVPNQAAAMLLSAIKGEMIKEMSRLKLGSAGAKRVMRNVKKFSQAYSKKTGEKITNVQAYRMLPDKFK